MLNNEPLAAFLVLFFQWSRLYKKRTKICILAKL